MISNKRILITGAGGFIGIHLAKLFSNRNNFILGLLINDQENKYLNKSIICDISDLNSLKILNDYEFDYVFHLAGLTNVKKSIENPLECFNVNCMGSINLIEIFRKKKIISFNFISTVGVLSKKNKLPISEQAEFGPTTPYAASKLTTESFLMAYGECFGFPYKIIRLFNVYGPGNNGLVIHDFINKLLQNPNELEILGDGEQIRDFLFIDDAVAGLEIISEKGINSNVYHLASGIPISINNLAKTIIKTMNFNNVKVTNTNKHFKGEFKKWYGNISKVKKIGFVPKTSLEMGISKTINWIKNQKK